eukprot:364870-Chlamydomonas_euryale.AAC.9
MRSCRVWVGKGGGCTALAYVQTHASASTRMQGLYVSVCPHLRDGLHTVGVPQQRRHAQCAARAARRQLPQLHGCVLEIVGGRGSLCNGCAMESVGERGSPVWRSCQKVCMRVGIEVWMWEGQTQRGTGFRAAEGRVVCPSSSCLKCNGTESGPLIALCPALHLASERQTEGVFRPVHQSLDGMDTVDVDTFRSGGNAKARCQRCRYGCFQPYGGWKRFRRNHPQHGMESGKGEFLKSRDEVAGAPVTHFPGGCFHSAASPLAR